MGDEFCVFSKGLRSRNDSSRTAFRQYYNEKTADRVKWLPLGPRFEWKPIMPEESIPINERSIPFNFMGSRTSHSREVLGKIFESKSMIQKYPWIEKGVLNMKNKWTKYLTDTKHYSKPADYRNTLLNSVFTFVASGQSPEAFRVYEAIDAGSIPVFSFDRSYFNAGCKNSFAPFINSNAPFVWVNGWETAPEILDSLLKDKKKIERMQLDLLQWRAKFWNNITRDIDCEVMTYFQKYSPDSALINEQSIDGKVDLDRFCGERKLPDFPKI